MALRAHEGQACNLKHVNAWRFLCSWSLSEGFQLKLPCYSIKLFIFINSDAWDCCRKPMAESELGGSAPESMCVWVRKRTPTGSWSCLLWRDFGLCYYNLGARCGRDSWNTFPFTQVIRTWHQREIENIRLKKVTSGHVIIPTQLRILAHNITRPKAQLPFSLKGANGVNALSNHSSHPHPNPYFD